MANRRDFITCAGSLVLGAAAGANASAQQVVGQTSIGVEGPSTGDMSQYGNQMANGVRAAIDDANNSRGALDRIYTMRTYDDSDSIAGGIVNAQFACSDNSIFAVVGHLSGRVTDAALTQYANGAMPIIVPSSSLDVITSHGYRNVFRLPTRDAIEGYLGATFMQKQFSPKRPLVVTQDGYYGPGVAQAVYQQLAADKLQPQQVVFPWEKPNYAAVAQQIMASAPDVIYLAGAVHDMGPVVPILRASGYTGNFFGSQGFFDPLTASQYAKELDGMIVSSSMPPLELAPTVFYIKQSYERKYGGMTPLIAFSYAAAQIVIQASRRVGAASRNALFSAIAAPILYQTIVGQFTFSTTGDPVNPNLYYYTVTNGKWRYFRADHPSDLLIK